LGRGKRTLLICDDEDGPRLSLNMIFKDDYHTLLADNGRAALALAREHAVDAAILDIRMAGMSGIDVLKALKQIDPTIEVIMLTAYETIETARQALRLGACDYLNKPFDLDTMRAAVGNAMERRSLSNQVRANNQKLAELQTELNQQKAGEESARTRVEIYGSIIHDINGPLTIISGMIDLINQRLGSNPTLSADDIEMIKDRLARITRQVTNCIEISRRYLSFLRERSAVTARVSGNQILTDLWELLKFHPQTKKHELGIRPFAQDLQIQVNGTDLIQMLLNLTMNAFQCSATPIHVEIHGEARPGPVALESWVDGAQDRYLNREGFNSKAAWLALLTVRDTGPGIPADVLARMFQAFFTTKADHQGTGLGLSIVQRLLRENQGALQVHTEVGRGTAFTLWLPATRSAPR
jgi:signal transduction histidine kinase